MRYFLSLGSNLGERAKNIAQAIYLLEKKNLKITKKSSLYESQPVDYTAQPWFLNQVIEAWAEFTPKAFLALIKKIEQEMGRKTSIPKGPRIIDVDILLVGDKIIRTEELEIPHPRLEKRNFILVPLKEISPNIIHPVLKESINDLWKKNKDDSVVRLVKDSL